jgi:hypothetical protein
MNIAQTVINPFVKNFTSVRKINLSAKYETKSQLFYLLIALNIFLFFSYVLGVNKNTSQGYKIRQEQVKFAKLTEENKKLNLKTTQISSMFSIQNEFGNNGFVVAGLPKFIEIKHYSLK